MSRADTRDDRLRPYTLEPGAVTPEFVRNYATDALPPGPSPYLGAPNPDADQLQRPGVYMEAQRERPGAQLTIRADGLARHPVVTLDGMRLRGLRGVTLDWHRGDIAPVAHLEIDLAHVDLDVVTLCWLIGRTESPATVEEAIRVLRRIKADMTIGMSELPPHPDDDLTMREFIQREYDRLLAQKEAGLLPPRDPRPFRIVRTLLRHYDRSPPPRGRDTPSPHDETVRQFRERLWRGQIAQGEIRGFGAAIRQAWRERLNVRACP